MVWGGVLLVGLWVGIGVWFGWVVLFVLGGFWVVNLGFCCLNGVGII